ncbi:MAG: FAD-dependent oxidoreductase [Chelatococcus sp.]|uniref:FAD-dependent oxidoreductase n=1 Tax=unclassified Chelatococcus TaxID=2638111 RepID=UPI001BCA8BD4|nr:MULTISPECIES: FAD-dependent oxidoreductase [unclassified Chelatococcus]CAH1649403.1 FAD dependent oxidoreductase [Hyphomicrobiales bacterium]MBS7741769.1 FAD-dependent oxidoreductase [Chelatococcus sp. HY11]MBX3537725.1 FAD-dependent oxidoreductase [Chelatococcus sp.]MBX3541433.1 FAD-dependent oxidoreductase [Chelatococcus sp.]MCO5074673.1 FAD-dependent oxidoreductase [Chelatococcus sp.]
MQYSRNLEVSASPDVLVCGAGCAGTVAAIAAAREGASVLLVERFGFSGGYVTGVIGASFDGFVDLRSGLPVVGGIVSDFAGMATGGGGNVMNRAFSPSNELREMSETPDRSKIRFNIEGFKRQADRLFKESGARVLYYTKVVDVIRKGSRVEGVVIANKAGLSVITPKMVVDASGDADAAAYAGADFDISEEMQPMSLHFRIGNVHIDRDTRDQCSAVLKEAHRKGDLLLYGGPWIGRLEADTEVYFNACRAAGSGIDPVDLTRAEVQGRIDAALMFDLFKRHVPAFRDAYLSSTGPFAGVRETRRIVGDSTLTAEDIDQQRSQEDVIALGCWYRDRHPKGASGYHMHEVVRPYDISYGTLLPRGIDNMIVAGRCHSADSSALASSRVTVTAMAMGEAAGTAAAMACAGHTTTRGLRVSDLQRRLLGNGAIILDRAEQVLSVGDAMEDVPVSAVR